MDQIFTLKQICKKGCEKKQRVYVGFIDLVNREVIWQVPQIYDIYMNAVMKEVKMGIQPSHYNFLFHLLPVFLFLFLRTISHQRCHLPTYVTLASILHTIYHPN